jgi:hypothetical protein
VYRNYSWSQTLPEVTVNVPVPPGTKARGLDVHISKSKLRVGLKGAAPIMEGALHEAVKPDDCLWNLVDNTVGEHHGCAAPHTAYWSMLCCAVPFDAPNMQVCARMVLHKSILYHPQVMHAPSAAEQAWWHRSAQQHSSGMRLRISALSLEDACQVAPCHHHVKLHHVTHHVKLHHVTHHLTLPPCPPLQRSHWPRSRRCSGGAQCCRATRR